MILRLVRRSLARRPWRSLLLLVGYALGVAVTVTLLSIGDALVDQSRDRRLVGGGDLAVIPRGLDLETLKTGGVTSLYFRIDQAPFLYRQVLAGARLEDRIRAAAPWIDDELLYLRGGDDPGPRPVSAAGRIPSRSAALGTRPELTAGSWSDLPADTRWTAPGDSALYAELDRFHLPPEEAAGDSTWAEWHYFNLRLPGDGGWLYLTYMIAGEVPDGRWGGRLLAARVRPPRNARAYEAEVPAGEVDFSTASPDLRLGEARVRLTGDGRYRLRARVPPAEGETGEGAGAEPLVLEATVVPAPGRYLPPVEASPGPFPSGYAVPVLRGSASGRLCDAAGCRRFEDAAAYHDHNWGTWRGVTWDWGQAQAGTYSLVYGRVLGPGGDASSAPGFAFLADSLGWLGAFSIDTIAYPARGREPSAVRLAASRGGDTLRLRARVRHLRSSPGDPSGGDGGARFLQMEGAARLRGRVLDEPLEASGYGFYETWTRPPSPPGTDRPR